MKDVLVSLTENICMGNCDFHPQTQKFAQDFTSVERQLNIPVGGSKKNLINECVTNGAQIQIKRFEGTSEQLERIHEILTESNIAHSITGEELVAYIVTSLPTR